MSVEDGKNKRCYQEKRALSTGGGKKNRTHEVSGNGVQKKKYKRKN